MNPEDDAATVRANRAQVKETVTMNTKASVTSEAVKKANEGQKKQIARMLADAIPLMVEKANISFDGAQRVINDSSEMLNAHRDAVREVLATHAVTNQFADEEVASTYGYLSGYRKPVEVEGQIDILRSHWPNLNPDAALRYCREVYPTLQLPDWVEGPFAIIRPGFFSDNYGEELAEVLKAIAKDRQGKFVNYREGRLGPEHLRQIERTISSLIRLCEQQPGSEILIVPCQFGLRHRGRSVRRAREVFVANEFGLGAFAVGIMLLTHPEREVQWEQLHIDCAGDEFSPVADGRFGDAPLFDFNDGEVRFGTGWVSFAGGRYGSASGFFSQ